MVIDKTNETSARVFPVVLDVKNPRFYDGLENLVTNNAALESVDSSTAPALLKFLRKLPHWIANGGQDGFAVLDVTGAQRELSAQRALMQTSKLNAMALFSDLNPGHSPWRQRLETLLSLVSAQGRIWWKSSWKEQIISVFWRNKTKSPASAPLLEWGWDPCISRWTGWLR